MCLESVLSSLRKSRQTRNRCLVERKTAIGQERHSFKMKSMYMAFLSMYCRYAIMVLGTFAVAYKLYVCLRFFSVIVVDMEFLQSNNPDDDNNNDNHSSS